LERIAILHNIDPVPESGRPCAFAGLPEFFVQIRGFCHRCARPGMVLKSDKCHEESPFFQ
jgi:hypothetical protein